MFPLNSYLVRHLCQEYQQKRLREAEVYQHLRRFTSARPPYWTRGLARVGEWLIVCGGWLKRRYDPIHAMPLNSNY